MMDNRTIYKGTEAITNAIELTDLTKQYPNFSLDHLNLILPMGCIMGFIGENGAGKSTTIHAMLGLISKNGGTVRLLGQEVGQDIPASIKEQIGVVLDECCFSEMLHAKDVNQIMKAAYRTWSEETFFQYLHRFSVDEKKRVKDYSRGMKMKLSISCALSHATRLLILDEATSGLDPVIRDEVVELFYEFTRDEQHSILISSHILSDLEKLCDYIAFLQKGKLLLCEEKDELLSRYCMVQGTPEEIYAIDPSKVLSEKHTAYGASAILRREDAPRDLQTSPIGMEELFIAMVKGGEHQ